MRFQVLATDYDGTLAHHGRVHDATVGALERLLATGRKVVMVTGRELPELLEIFPHLELFDWVVAENGALLYRPSTKEEKPLGEPPSKAFVDALKRRGVEPLSVGRVIVATFEPHEQAVLEAIHELGIERQVIFNKGAVMVLPAGVNKATGLTAALAAMSLSPHNVVGVGDAENDHAFLQFCELGAAVANALPALKDTADIVTEADHGAGVVELIDAIVENDLGDYDGIVPRRRIPFASADEDEVSIEPHGPTILVCGPSASGKSTLVTSIVEALAGRGYQFCLFDPEGDYENFEAAVTVGGASARPADAEVLQILKTPTTSAIVNLTGLAIADRPPFFLNLLGPILQMRSSLGRPHWLVLDEAHHLLPAQWLPPQGMLPEELRDLILITVHPVLLAPALLDRIDTLMIVGNGAAETLADFCRAARIDAPRGVIPELESGQALLWCVKDDLPPQLVQVKEPKTERHRHRRKYAEGELPPDRSFFFRGPEGKLNLRAQNLKMFLQLADGVDDDTWEFHRRQHDYSQWFRSCIKDDNLAEAAAKIEADHATPADSRSLLRAAIEKEYVVMPPGRVARAWRQLNDAEVRARFRYDAGLAWTGVMSGRFSARSANSVDVGVRFSVG